MCSPAEKWGFLDRKLPSPGQLREGEGKWGFSDPETLFFQEMGIRGPVWGRGSLWALGVLRESPRFALAKRGPSRCGSEEQDQAKEGFERGRNIDRKRAEYSFGEYGFKHRAQ